MERSRSQVKQDYPDGNKADLQWNKISRMKQSRSPVKQDFPDGTKPISIRKRFAVWYKAKLNWIKICRMERIRYQKKSDPSRMGPKKISRKSRNKLDGTKPISREGTISEQIKGGNYPWANKGWELSLSNSRKRTIYEPFKRGNNLWANQGREQSLSESRLGNYLYPLISGPDFFAYGCEFHRNLIINTPKNSV